MRACYHLVLRFHRMKGFRRFLRILVTACLALVAAPSFGQTSTTNDDFWPEVDVYVKLSPDYRLFFLVAPVREAGAHEFDNVQVGANIDIGLLPYLREAKLRKNYDKDRLRFLRLRFGLRFLTSLEDDDHQEWRVIGELTPRVSLPWEMSAAFRNRLDLRWINDVYSWRYRPRIWLEREFHVASRFSLVPHVSAEIYYDSRYDTWERTQYQLGTVATITTRLAVEVYYARQRDTEPSLTYTNALGTMAILYF